jgi:hypothetical protein
MSSIVPIPIRQHLIVFILFTNITFSQQVIIPAGNPNESFGQVFPIMQSDMTDIEVSLSVPKWEVPIQTTKPIVKKKLNWWQKLLKAIFG